MTIKLKKIGGVYHTQVTAAGKSKWISTRCTTKPEAEKVLAQSSVAELEQAGKAASLSQRAIGQILTGKNLTCLKAVEEYRKVAVASKAQKTVFNVVLVVLNWLKELKLETQPPSAITPEHISKWINNPQSTWKRGTRLAALASIRTFFQFCAHHGWIASDPSQLVAVDYSVMSHEQKEDSDRQPFTIEEVKHLLTELRHDWAAAAKGEHRLFRKAEDVLFWLVAVTVGKETGLRLSDVAGLEWRCFSEPGKLVVWTGKTNQRIEHEISDTLQELIGEIPVNDPDYLFPEQRATIQNVAKRAALSVQFGRLCERLNIKGKSFHNLRHFKATSEYAKLDKNALAKKLAEVLSLEQIAQLLGHANSKTTKGYVH
jgi:integrase